MMLRKHSDDNEKAGQRQRGQPSVREPGSRGCVISKPRPARGVKIHTLPSQSSRPFKAEKIGPFSKLHSTPREISLSRSFRFVIQYSAAFSSFDPAPFFRTKGLLLHTRLSLTSRDSVMPSRCHTLDFASMTLAPWTESGFPSTHFSQ